MVGFVGIAFALVAGLSLLACVGLAVCGVCHARIEVHLNGRPGGIGFGVIYQDRVGLWLGGRLWPDFTFPLWGAVFLCGLPPWGWLLVRDWRSAHRRIIDGFCPACGYGLTGNLSRTCPECGTKFSEWEEAIR